MDKLQEIKNCEDVVDWLVSNSFNSLNIETKSYVVKSIVQPRPNLITLRDSDSRQNRGFNTVWYDKCEWLTGSSKQEKLFCWPCLLFSTQTEYTSWTKTGFCSLKNLPRSIERHSKSKDHIWSSCKIKLFSKQNIVSAFDNTRRNEIISHNNQVRENRSNVKRLIDATIFLASQNLAFRGHDETKDSVNRGNYRELLALLSKYDSSFNNFIENKVFSGTSKTIQNDIIYSLSFVLKSRISKEIQDTNFFAWQVDETTDISCASQLSIIFRYVTNGEVVERFLGFYNVSSGRTADDLFNLLIHECDKYNFRNKLIAQTYDGAAVMAGHLNGLQSKIKSVAPTALFTHCYAHKLNLVLSKACNINKDCRIFFSNLSGFSSFFQSLPNVPMF